MVDKLAKRIYLGDNRIGVLSLKHLPRWIVLLIDIFILFCSIFLSSFLHPVFTFNFSEISPLLTSLAIILGVNIVFFYILKTYAGIIRHSTFTDLFKVILSSLFTFFVLISIHYFVLLVYKVKLFSFAFLLLYAFSSVLGLVIFRMLIKELYRLFKVFSNRTSNKNVLILGIDDMSISLATAIMDNRDMPYNVKGFYTEREDSKKALFLGKPTYCKKQLEEFSKEELGVDGVIFIRGNLTRKQANDLVTFFLNKNMEVFKAPAVQKLRDKESIGAIKNLQIEDLLNRKEINIQSEEVKKRHFGKAVLVTGGAGSIGSEIVRQVASFKPSVLVVLDQAETPLYDIQLEIKESFPDVEFKFILADVRDEKRLDAIFEEYQFSMVYHAAAYKHVPLVENNPSEGVAVNVLGSRNLSLLASKYKVNRFVMVSTDKAVNPTNVMGASKRVAELFVQSLQKVEGNTTKFITTRFGNVLGSNGSVIPYFKKQIAKGGPVTITHKDIVRYFMTIPEACNLVLQAGTMGSGGEIYVFDMGEPIKILDLARRMIKLSGLEPEIDIEIVFTGLRPGEKLYEELLTDNAKTLDTHHDKIMISKDPLMGFDKINEYIANLDAEIPKCHQENIVRILKEIVPEFKSNNSVYESLDNK
ncbi:MAG: polysaccharide biosynthesis protein [Flavobacteriales bacterium]|nr:MAG: polysaccharide biosynthesis protein [Flavobacteriales bacterium]